MTHAKTERNAALVAAWEAGAQPIALAAEYGITQERVRKLLQLAGHPSSHHRVELLARIDTSGGAFACWLWTGPTLKGYGRFGRGGYAHRAAYEHFIGPIPAGLHLDHLCRTTLCCNPAHLEPVTHGENTRRQNLALADERTACKHGHELPPRGFGRRCQTCRRAYVRPHRSVAAA